ncbi:MAG: hypothetical protein HQL94_05630 [Magnetococcales bacterium]|nr:hypothetical protein [Magnetococcales bacterium]MBF0437524.1 hypothetical protein [Magnetococcales bacterium]
MQRIVFLAGPSCVGKRPLVRIMRMFYPELMANFKQLVLFNDRTPSPGEEEGVDSFFRPRGEIEALRGKDGFIVADVRGDLQALEVAQIQRIFAAGQIPFFEGNPFVPGKLREAGLFEQFPTVSVFLSPLSREEILYLKSVPFGVDLNKFVSEVQRRKLLHRVMRQKSHLSLRDLEDIEKRSANALTEMREAWKFDHVIHLHDGEGHDNWDANYYPIGSARKAMLALASVLRNDSPLTGIDDPWTEDLIL